MSYEFICNISAGLIAVNIMITQALMNLHQFLLFVPQDIPCLKITSIYCVLPYYSCPVNHDSSENNSNVVMPA